MHREDWSNTKMHGEDNQNARDEQRKDMTGERQRGKQHGVLG